MHAVASPSVLLYCFFYCPHFLKDTRFFKLTYGGDFVFEGLDSYVLVVFGEVTIDYVLDDKNWWISVANELCESVHWFSTSISSVQYRKVVHHLGTPGFSYDGSWTFMSNCIHFSFHSETSKQMLIRIRESGGLL